MRIGFRLFLACALGSVCLNLAVGAEDKPAFKDEREKASYAVGVIFGNQIKNGNLDLDPDTVSKAMNQVLTDSTPKLSQQEAHEAIMAYQQQARAKISEKNKKEGDLFLAQNKSKPGVKSETVTLPDGKTAEFQYKVITEGAGDIPKATDRVSVNYRGSLIDGKEFDNSAKHGGPVKFAVNGVVRGWTEALERMKIGSKWELYLPSTLAYGDAPPPRSGIEPGATLIFEMELVGTEAPPPPPPAREPLTSDIIKVPSAEELKKGAKIEVLKPEDVAREMQKQTSAPAAKKP